MSPIMSDKFSVDDILEEYSAKRANGINADRKSNADIDSIIDKANSAKSAPAEPLIKPGDDSQESAESAQNAAAAGDTATEAAETVNAEQQAYSEPVAADSQDAEQTIVMSSAADGIDLGDVKFDKSNKRHEKKKSRINTSVIERLVKEKKGSETVSVTGAIPPVNRASVKDIDMGLEGKIIPKTEQLEISDDLTDDEKMAILEKRREQKVQNFVLDNDRQEQQAREAQQSSRQQGEPLPIEEFTSFDQSQDVLQDIQLLKSNIVVRMCVLVFTSLFALYLSLANDFKLPIVSIFSRDYSPEAFVFTLTILGIITAFVSYTVIFSGLKKLFAMKADCDSIAAIGIVLTVITGIINLFAPDSIQSGSYHVYTAAAILGMLFNTLGKLSIINRAERNFRFASGEFEKYAFAKIEDEDIAYKFTKGTLDDFPELVTTRKTEFVDDFLRNSYSSDISDEYSRKAAPIMVIAGVLAALLSLIASGSDIGAAEKIITALSAMCGLVTLCSSMALMLIVNLPLARASKKFLQSSAVMLGYSAVEEYSDTNSVLIDAEQLFPEGMVDLVNLKAMSSTLIEDCILYAASLECQAGGVMKPTFYKMLRGKTEMLYPVESYIYEDGLGLSGWIEHKRILFGSRELMVNHSIEGLPTPAKESEYAKGNIPMYLSISGVVSAIFFIRANASLTVGKWLQRLTDRGITVVIRSVDAFISPQFISDTFEVETSKLKLIPFRFHSEYENERSYTPKISSSMMCSGHFPSIAMLVCGTKNVQSMSVLGMMLQLTASALGAVIALIMIILGSMSQVTASVVIGYNLIWLAVTLLVQQCKRV